MHTKSNVWNMVLLCNSCHICFIIKGATFSEALTRRPEGRSDGKNRRSGSMINSIVPVACLPTLNFCENASSPHSGGNHHLRLRLRIGLHWVLRYMMCTIIITPNKNLNQKGGSSVNDKVIVVEFWIFRG